MLPRCPERSWTRPRARVHQPTPLDPRLLAATERRQGAWASNREIRRLSLPFASQVPTTKFVNHHYFPRAQSAKGPIGRRHGLRLVPEKSHQAELAPARPGGYGFGLGEVVEARSTFLPFLQSKGPGISKKVIISQHPPDEPIWSARAILAHAKKTGDSGQAASTQFGTSNRAQKRNSRCFPLRSRLPPGLTRRPQSSK
jgi:hypothetical protein